MADNYGPLSSFSGRASRWLIPAINRRGETERAIKQTEAKRAYQEKQTQDARRYERKKHDASQGLFKPDTYGGAGPQDQSFAREKCCKG